MKTKWKKFMIYPLLSLALSLLWIPNAKAGLWEDEQVRICRVQVQVDSGGEWVWCSIQGVEFVCVPMSWSWCYARGCTPLLHEGTPQQ